MDNCLTKSAIHKAMEAAESEGQTFTWRSLDRIFSATVTGDGASIAERLEDDRVNYEVSRECSAENTTEMPAYATPSDGGAVP